MKTILTALLVMTLLVAACGTDAEPEAAIETERETETDETVVEEPTEEEPTDPGADESAADVSADTTGSGEVLTPAGFSLNGFRYCEVLMTVPGDDGSLVTEVWGTPGVGPCPDDDWAAIDPDALMVEFDATWLHMNGPRYFTVDGAVDTAPPGADSADTDQEIRNFGAVPMRLLATVGSASEDGVAYNPELVVRTTTWTFNAGSEVYELTDPGGITYIMQSYALIEDPDLTAEDLPSLGDRLDLPEGWSYNPRVLDEDLQVALTPDGAIVVQDEFQNSYQRN